VNDDKSDHKGDTDVFRVIDANANRALEGLRVIEECARFQLDDKFLTQTLKNIRHKTAKTLQQIPPLARMLARDTASDVGTQCQTATEYQRSGIGEIVRANIARVGEALRCIEEFSKVIAPPVAAEIEAIRYSFYTASAALEIVSASVKRLADAQLYVLVDGCRSPANFERRLAELVAGKADVIQLRDKHLSDRELLGRANLARKVTAGTKSAFIMNDRPDLAALSRADGVHVGQDELSVREVRRIAGNDVLVGVSTHDIEQARRAVLEGANYIGCGPTFLSSTKQFQQFAGLDFLRQVSAEISLPAFAIGGISLQNIAQVKDTGFTRVAVSGAVANAACSTTALAELSAALRS
jgi:thiamine-phosphate pyrophosphorylase